MKTQLTATQLLSLALEMATGPEKVKEGLAPGVYEIDETIRIKGAVRKGESYDSVVNAAVDWRGLFAFALTKLNGVTVDSIVREFVNVGTVDADEVDKQAKAAVKTILGTTIKECSGKTTAALTVTSVRE